MPRQGRRCMENPRRHSAGSAATRRLRYLLALAGDYLKYLFMKRRRLMHKVARRTLALVHRHHGGERSKNHPWPTRALMEREFSCADSPSPAFLVAKRLLLRSRLKGGGAAAAAAGAVSSCFGSFRAPCGSSETAAASEAEAAAVEEEDLSETEDEEEDDHQVLEDGWVQCGELLDVDDRAEEFINMFYEQLRAQSFAAVFQSSP
ncbi:hypothetical protein BAE44_0024691 [Dichanthelium oligosanthes]|uniref:Uncharacterized protein n=1 Tax=Dichanthelium oligosanthes TaxID=888268 RepID=A0A1E5UN29_9POAL|nr:hypothetical protein BAE44_0024691 [Dichanthelium oligosanthes]